MAGKEVLNVAVIGLGMGRAHARSYQGYPRAKLAALCDADADRLSAGGQEFGLPEGRLFTDYREMFARAGEVGLDAVSIALPNFLHAPVSIAAFEAGLHVMCEKPMAMNVVEAHQMLVAQRRSGCKFMINLSFRFTPPAQALRRVVQSGALGEIYFGRTAWHRRRGLPGFGGWFGTKKLSGGGPIIDLGVHRLDLAMWLMGNPAPRTVSASAYNVIGTRLAQEQQTTFDVEDLGCAMIRFDNGATLLLEASWAGYNEKREDMSTYLLGSKGGLLHRNVGEGYDFEACVFSEREGSLWSEHFQQPAVPMVSAYEDFIDAVLDDREPSAPGEHGLNVQLILDAIYDSAGRGEEVRIEPPTDS